MSGPNPDRMTRRLPKGLLGMLALVAAVEMTIAARHLDFTTIWADDWRQTAEAATRQAKHRDVLCFGSSLIKYGMLPREIEARTGFRSYNLAINAGTMPSAFFLLRRSLESGAKPKAIVADFFALMMPERPRNSERMYPELASLRDCLGLAWAARDADFLTAMLVSQVLPSYKCRFEIRASVLAAFDGQRASPWPRQAYIWETWKGEDGAQPSPSNPARPSPHPQMVADLSPAKWSCDPVNAVYLEKFLALAKDRKVPVFWLMPPLGPEIHALRALTGSDAAYAEQARAILERYPDVVVLDARGSGYDASVHVDAIHLDRRGAKVLTGDVAILVADRLRGRGPIPRWVDLPPFAGRTGDEPSRDVARAGGTRAR